MGSVQTCSIKHFSWPMHFQENHTSTKKHIYTKNYLHTSTHNNYQRNIKGGVCKANVSWEQLNGSRRFTQYHKLLQPSQLGKKFDSKFLSSIFASSKAFRRQKFSCLFLLAARVHDWIILHSYVEKQIFAKKTFYWPTCT